MKYLLSFLLLISSFPVFAQQLEALLVVGNTEGQTSKAIKDMNKMAELFQKNGVKVHRFYDKKAKWEDIIKVAPKCSFFVYSGHGSTAGIDGKSGGICIDFIVGVEQMLKEMRLKKGAMVVFRSVCRGAGSSAGDILETPDIGVKEAKKRVSEYAAPFFEIGASAYYANNKGQGCYGFLEDFLKGKTLKKAYLESIGSFSEVEFEKDFGNGRKISIASSEYSGTSTVTQYVNGKKTVKKIKGMSKTYSIAYVGAINYSLANMHK